MNLSLIGSGRLIFLEEIYVDVCAGLLVGLLEYMEYVHFSLRVYCSSRVLYLSNVASFKGCMWPLEQNLDHL